jgi:hypothetical protein
MIFQGLSACDGRAAISRPNPDREASLNLSESIGRTLRKGPDGLTSQYSNDRAEDLDRSQWDLRITRLYDYWRSKHHEDGSLPTRGDIDPLEIPDLLAWIWMVDIHRDPTRFKFRLFGTRHVEAMGKDVTGQWIDEAYPDFPTSIGYTDYLKVADDLLPSYRKGPAHYHVPDYKTIERIMLPLVDGEGRGKIILALTVYS